MITIDPSKKYYFVVDGDKELSHKIQDRLFELGYSWLTPDKAGYYDRADHASLLLLEGEGDASRHIRFSKEPNPGSLTTWSAYWNKFGRGVTELTLKDILPEDRYFDPLMAEISRIWAPILP